MQDVVSDMQQNSEPSLASPLRFATINIIPYSTTSPMRLFGFHARSGKSLKSFINRVWEKATRDASVSESAAKCREQAANAQARDLRRPNSARGNDDERKEGKRFIGREARTRRRREERKGN